MESIQAVPTPGDDNLPPDDKIARLRAWLVTNQYDLGPWDTSARIHYTDAIKQVIAAIDSGEAFKEQP